MLDLHNTTLNVNERTTEHEENRNIEDMTDIEDMKDSENRTRKQHNRKTHRIWQFILIRSITKVILTRIFKFIAKQTSKLVESILESFVFGYFEEIRQQDIVI